MRDKDHQEQQLRAKYSLLQLSATTGQQQQDIAYFKFLPQLANSTRYSLLQVSATTGQQQQYSEQRKETLYTCWR
jgi:hypothetical protein